MSPIENQWYEAYRSRFPGKITGVRFVPGQRVFYKKGERHLKPIRNVSVEHVSGKWIHLGEYDEEMFRSSTARLEGGE